MSRTIIRTGGTAEMNGHASRNETPDAPAEPGLRSEHLRTRTDVLTSVAILGGMIGLGIVAAGLLSRRREAARRNSSGGSGSSTLHANAEKALRLKQEAGPQTNIPEHRTSHQGGVRGGQVGYSDTAIGREPTYTPNLKRSHNARSGDA